MSKRDPVNTDLRNRVLRRDKMCVISKLSLIPGHVCRDQWGRPHAPTALHKLTVEHVKDDLMMGRRAPSDEKHLVAMCWAANVGVPSKEVRQALRTYLSIY